MEEAGLVFVDTAGFRFGRISQAGNGNGGGIQKLSLMEVMAKKRQRLSDITNTANHLQRNSRSRPGQENPNLAPLQHTKDYIAELLKENTALLRLLGEKNKIVEMNALELQKLRISFQQLQQQNCQLARTNTLMLEELNLGKDRLKALQHELGCTVAMLKTTKLELEEKRKSVQDVADKRINLKEVPSSINEDTVKQLNPAGKDGCNLKRKRASRRCSLGSAPLEREASAKETNGNCGRRRSSRNCRKSEACVKKEQQISELKVRSSKCEAKSLRQVDTAVDPSKSRSPPMEALKVEEDGDVREASAKETNGNCGRRRSSRTCRKSEPCVEKEQQMLVKLKMRQVDTAVDPSNSRSPPIEELKVEEDGDVPDAPEPTKQELDRRSITGRPQRRSTAGVSYKEKSLRVKMRRS